MKPILTAILIFTFLTLQPARADSPGDGRLGAGVVIGSPTALTGKYWTASDQAIDFGISFSSYRWTMLYGDYHWYWPEIFGHKIDSSANSLYMWESVAALRFGRSGAIAANGYANVPEKVAPPFSRACLSAWNGIRRSLRLGYSLKLFRLLQFFLVRAGSSMSVWVFGTIFDRDS